MIACNKKTEPTQQLCYAYENGNDTVQMSLNINGERVTGELTYMLFEKDSNRGQVKGTFSGDTLTADYTFQSEGMRSVREVIFVKNGSSLRDIGLTGFELQEVKCN